MQLNPEDVKELTQHTRQWVAKANQLYTTEANAKLPYPKIHLDLTSNNAGEAHLKANLLRYNPILFSENKAEFLNVIVPHEVAHLAAWHFFEEPGHRIKWKRVMRMFGLPPAVHHSFTLTNLPSYKRKFTANCSCARPVLLTRKKMEILVSGQDMLCPVCCKFYKPSPDSVHRMQKLGVAIGLKHL